MQPLNYFALFSNRAPVVEWPLPLINGLDPELLTILLLHDYKYLAIIFTAFIFYLR